MSLLVRSFFDGLDGVEDDRALFLDFDAMIKVWSDLLKSEDECVLSENDESGPRNKGIGKRKKMYWSNYFQVKRIILAESMFTFSEDKSITYDPNI